MTRQPLKICFSSKSITTHVAFKMYNDHVSSVLIADQTGELSSKLSVYMMIGRITGTASTIIKCSFVNF